MAYHNQTEIYKELAEKVCQKWLKAMHSHLINEGILAQAFPIASHRRDYVDQWIDEMRYSDIETFSEWQKAVFHNAGVMINGRIYSVEVEPKREPFIPLRQILENRPLDEHYFLRQEDMQRWIYAKGAKHEKRYRKDGSEYYFSEGAVKFPEPLDMPSRTMLTSETQIGRTSHVVIDPYTQRLRVLTPTECERLNGFPENWTDTGMPEKMRYFCMGNALVVDIVKKIAKAILFDNYIFNGNNIT